MFRCGAMSFLAGAVVAVTMMGSTNPIRMTSERCSVPMAPAHGGIDLSFCEDLAASALLRPELQIKVLRRIEQVHAERANTATAREYLRNAMSFGPLDRNVRRQYAEITKQHTRFTMAFVSAETAIERQVAGLSADG